MKFETSVKEVLPRTADTVSYRFPKPSDFSFKPGQYMMVTVRSDTKELVHPFSISSSPTDQDFIEFTKKLTGSEYSSRLREMKPGDWASIDGPYGKFTCECEFEKILFLAGGIGITPFYSIIKYCTVKKLPTSMKLLYGVKNEKEIAFKTELDEMQHQNPNLNVVYVVFEPSSNWKGRTGIITADLIQNEVPDFTEYLFYLCGPPGMVIAMQKLAASLGLPETQIKMESFAGHT
jgi:ferredoxin-NADP reductase